MLEGGSTGLVHETNVVSRTILISSLIPVGQTATTLEGLSEKYDFAITPCKVIQSSQSCICGPACESIVAQWKRAGTGPITQAQRSVYRNYATTSKLFCGLRNTYTHD